ncbi:hypothetical protein PSQ20_11290 [Curvibacter sp. RS43]|uniref:Universal stress protein n=1 Tax=Curvibacter microcysteis TaxID=3026419 RepID=A0ABT5MJN9_9BURK|nr:MULTISPECIES: hypothetical protein [unclassified Curvibacter]MDD0810925.1 hypothetical protein [Curvibacter sp. RS43]MDD0816119.1 hypothetical protein [Curvibacter sp. HBC28]
MDTLIAYIDDGEHASQLLLPMRAARAADAPATQWILVACPPRMTRRVSQWVSHANREHWRARWADKVLGPLVQELRGQGDQVSWQLAQQPLAALTQSLRQQHPTARVLDARRPKLGVDLAPVSADQPASHDARWSVPGAVVGLGAALLLAAD